jgi:hypothetical protein
MVSWEFFIDIILPVDSASNRNKCQEYFLGVKPEGLVQACNGIALHEEVYPEVMYHYEVQALGLYSVRCNGTMLKTDEQLGFRKGSLCNITLASHISFC